MSRILRVSCLALLLGVAVSGCGSTKSRSATEQLLLSDAVDRSIASIDFRPLSGRKVYLDTKFVKSVKGPGFVNADYIVSSLRQQMLAANCYLVDKEGEAEYVAEVRVGALGTDSHNVTYGIPPSNSLSSAASLVPNAPPIPMVPEISFAKREDEMAAAKIAVFAYQRDSRRAVWQSGIAQARSSAKDVWLFGAGPFQRGTIHDRFQFAGEELEIPLVAGRKGKEQLDAYELYERNYSFVQPPASKETPEKQGGAVQQASHEDKTPPQKGDKQDQKKSSPKKEGAGKKK